MLRFDEKSLSSPADFQTIYRRVGSGLLFWGHPVEEGCRSGGRAVWCTHWLTRPEIRLRKSYDAPVAPPDYKSNFVAGSTALRWQQAPDEFTAAAEHYNWRRLPDLESRPQHARPRPRTSSGLAAPRGQSHVLEDYISVGNNATTVV